MADSIRVSADLLLTVINDILDFSKMEADKMKLYIIAFNPEEMVREVVRAVSYSNREKTSKKNVKIIQDINLPPMLIYGDPIRLHQVLGNLIGNSLKFTEDGSITIGARLDHESEESATLTFWVRDTGIGIPPQQLAKLFQPFSQADASTARKYGGSGLGLSICKSLIEIMMNGKIQLESEENVGTTAWFTVAFDKAKPDVSAGDAQAKSSPPLEHATIHNASPGRNVSPNPFIDLSKIPKEEVRICVAEDNPINQKIAIQYVQRLGFPNVHAYENGQKAVEGLRKQALEGKPYHIVLMDVMMPVLDGYEATKMIRKDPIDAVRNILVIAMTASAIQGDREKCLDAGMNDYLAKPVRSEILKKKLDAYLNPVVGSALPLVVRLAHGEADGSETQDADLMGKSGYHPSPLAISTSPTDGQDTVVSPPPNTSSGSPAEVVVADPMQEEAVFNQPLDSSGFKSADSPTYGAETVPEIAPLTLQDRLVLDASTQDSTERRGARANPSPDASSPPTQRKPTRKLTKSRGASLAWSDVPSGEKAGGATARDEKPGTERGSSDKSRNVLVKKPPQQQSAPKVGEDGRTPENTRPGGVEERRGSVPSRGTSSLEDKVFSS